MPSINIYTDNERVTAIKTILSELRVFVANELSCNELKLKPDEISIRIIIPKASLQIANTELEIKAHGFKERILKQDSICLNIKKFLENNCPKADTVYVWLQLSELGHSA